MHRAQEADDHGGGTLATNASKADQGNAGKDGRLVPARKSRLPLAADILGTSMLHEYSAVSMPHNVTWAVDTGASYDVASAGLADEMGW